MKKQIINEINRIKKIMFLLEQYDIPTDKTGKNYTGNVYKDIIKKKIKEKNVCDDQYIPNEDFYEIVVGYLFHVLNDKDPEWELTRDAEICLIKQIKNINGKHELHNINLKIKTFIKEIMWDELDEKLSNNTEVNEKFVEYIVPSIEEGLPNYNLDELFKQAMENNTSINELEDKK